MSNTIEKRKPGRPRKQPKFVELSRAQAERERETGFYIKEHMPEVGMFAGDRGTAQAIESDDPAGMTVFITFPDDDAVWGPVRCISFDPEGKRLRFRGKRSERTVDVSMVFAVTALTWAGGDIGTQRKGDGARRLLDASLCPKSGDPDAGGIEMPPEPQAPQPGRKPRESDGSGEQA